jgi:hypothetical protein
MGVLFTDGNHIYPEDPTDKYTIDLQDKIRIKIARDNKDDDAHFTMWFKNQLLREIIIREGDTLEIEIPNLFLMDMMRSLNKSIYD